MNFPGLGDTNWFEASSIFALSSAVLMGFIAFFKVVCVAGVIAVVAAF